MCLFVGNSANNKQNVLTKLDVGDRITKDILAKGEGGSNLDAKTWLSAIGVGPKLVTNGSSDINVRTRRLHRSKSDTIFRC